MKRRSLAALLAAALAGAVPAVASALALQWALVGVPLTATANQSTTFTLTATNLLMLNDLGCIEVDLPASFVIESLGVPSASNNDPWVSGAFGNAVIVRSLSGGGRLALLESVQFTIRAHATVAGAFLWQNHAHRQQDCSTADVAGVPLAVTVLPAILPTPTPTPTPTATPTPTPTPTATPAPTATPRPTGTPAPTPTPSPILPLPSFGLPLPTLLPTASPTATPDPGATPDPAATPDPTSRSSATPEPSSSPAASDGSGATGAGPSPGGGGGAGSGDAPALLVARGADQAGDDAGVGVELLGLLDADFVWLVPGASVAVPGLLVILWVVLQAMGALAWIPAVRRMADESGGRRS